MNSFAIIFQIILLRFKVFAFHVQNSEGTYYAGHGSVAAAFNSELWFSFIQNQQELQGFFGISIFHFLSVGLENSISEHSPSLCLHESENPKHSTTLLNPAAKKLFYKKVFV